ncbi:AAC(3) family N-acetyltransferase [Bacteroides faecium]|nr:AAC(3) family N-acetyltransferase [Bacteroides faecium]
MVNIKSFLKGVLSPELRSHLKRLKRHLKERMKGDVPQTSLDELKGILVNDLGLQSGDKIIVSSGFGNLNAKYSPQEVIELLQSIVTKNGVIMMAYYPPMNSDEWAKGNHIFDMKNTKSGMGILTNVFSKMPDVYKSIHPTKAVCVWGKNAQIFAGGHENSQTPFYWDSPYGKLLKEECKSLGLGVKNIPAFHALEDVLSKDKAEWYLSDKFLLKVRLENGEEKDVKTYIHNSKLMNSAISPGDYVASLHCKTYKRVDFGFSFIYVVDNTDLYNEVKIKYEQNITRLKK